MTDAQAELIRCLDAMAELARRRATERPDGIRHEQYEQIAAMASEGREQLQISDFPHMGIGAGLGYGKGLGEWGFPENGDDEMTRLGYRADELYRTGRAS